MALTLKVLAAGVLSGTSDTAIYPSGATTQAGKTALVNSIVLYNRNAGAIAVELTVRMQNGTIVGSSPLRGAYIFKASVPATSTQVISTPELTLLLNTGPDAIYLKGTTDIEYIVNGFERDI